MRKCFLAALCGVSPLALFSAASAEAAVVANLLTNHSFETPDVPADGESTTVAGWSKFNDALTTQSFPAQDGEQTLKIYGPFFQGGGAGVVQGGFAASPGQTWEASAWARNPATDAIGANNFAVVKVEFLNSSNGVIAAFESPQFNTAAPKDVWTPLSALGVAPDGTTSAQIVLVHVQLEPIDGGSVVFDNASLGIAVPEPAAGLAGLALIGLAMRRGRVH